MRERLPVDMDRLDLPVDNFKYEEHNTTNNNYGYVSFMYLLSLLITLASVITLIVLGR